MKRFDRCMIPNMYP